MTDPDLTMRLNEYAERRNYDDIMNQTANRSMDLDNNQDPEVLMIKSSLIAQYITADQILEKRHGINEAQLKRVLYRQYYDELEAKQGLGFKVRKYFSFRI